MTKSARSDSPPVISVGVHEAKTRLSELLRAVLAGQEVEICRGRSPVARLVPVTERRSRRFGHDVGVFDVPDDFDEPLDDELLGAFER